MQIHIIPTINVKTQEEFVHQLRAVEDVSPIVQIDIADGKFTDWENWHDSELIREMHTHALYELHLMVQKPHQELEHWKDVHNISRIIVHIESLSESIEAVFRPGVEMSVALNPETPIEALEPMIQKLSYVTLLGVTPGPSGQKTDIHLLERIHSIRARHPNINIEVDGGVNANNIADMIRAGANILCVGSAVFGTGDPKQNILKLKELAENAV